MKCFLSAIFFLVVLSCKAATYYVDLDGGNDASAGTSQGTAWKTIPGTRNVGDTAFVTLSYGSGTIVSNSVKVQASDNLMLKRGTVHDSTDGGKVLIDTTYYVNTANTTNNPITLKPDITWGSGPVEFNGTGMTLGGGGWGLIHIKVNGVVVDGVSGTNGIIVAFSPYDGISGFPIGSDIQGPTIRHVFFGTNGTTYTPGFDDASAANIQLIRSHGGVIADCVIMAGQSSFEGVCLGENHLSCYDYIVTNVTVADLNGVDDGGIAFKAFNSQVQFLNCTATRCYKGFDLGEQNGDGSNILYKVVGGISYSNVYGMNFNGPGAAYAGTVNFYAINCTIYTNASTGIYVYAGPYNLHIIHNTLFNNGLNGNFDDCNVRCENDGVERNFINSYIINNIFYKPAGNQNYYNLYFKKDFEADGMNLTMDNNSWTRRSTESFAKWAVNNPLPDNTIYDYGTDGPGHASGNWWSWYSGDTVAPTNGRLGHFHADAYSVGTGASDTSLPPFANYPTDLRFTHTYSGTNISSRSWFTAEMGFDANGRARTTWDMGALEFDPNFVPYRVANPGKIKGVHFTK